jgi:predicted GTPase
MGEEMSNRTRILSWLETREGEFTSALIAADTKVGKSRVAHEISRLVKERVVKIMGADRHANIYAKIPAYSTELFAKPPAVNKNQRGVLGVTTHTMGIH